MLFLFLFRFSLILSKANCLSAGKILVSNKRRPRTYSGAPTAVAIPDDDAGHFFFRVSSCRSQASRLDWNLRLNANSIEMPFVHR